VCAFFRDCFFGGLGLGLEGAGLGLGLGLETTGLGTLVSGLDYKTGIQYSVFQMIPVNDSPHKE